MLINRIIVLVIGYFCGIFLSGYAYSRFKHKDITQMGSGNAGTTNTFRMFGWKAGLITLLGDVSKPIAAILITWLLFHKSQPEGVRLLELYAGLGTIIGHNHPFYMKNFKGGKGIACTGGMMIAFCPIEVPLGLGLFIVVTAVTKYVSVGSVVGLVSFFVQTIVFGELGLLDVTEQYRIEVYVLAAVIMLMGIVRHRENIKRLLNGNENKLSLKKKERTVS
jgi:glycerol-3-phosphate acyltransferase PlsY